MFVCLLHTEEDVPEDQRPFVKKAAGAAKFPAFTTTTTMVSSRAFQKEKAAAAASCSHGAAQGHYCAWFYPKLGGGGDHHDCLWYAWPFLEADLEGHWQHVPISLLAAPESAHYYCIVVGYQMKGKHSGPRNHVSLFIWP